ncbi:CidA/LrgA family protein [Vibrio ulleungensis]|uniref:CidA/LrgA family protein n=1 Tax=Vibrio ulleungensis TaxID=2807619 RepID=A0ABS2HJ19_9VIBR|nr:CidA/LrgA family protein [Vibrio ulleungensis]MBM7035847.1 CidA/LrgA family protein [Vibrio ulleungensis]
MNILLRYITSAALIVLCLFIGNTLQQVLHLAVPGSVIGLLLLFGLLVSGAVKPVWVEKSASLLIKYMILLFVPVSVGVMVHLDTLADNFWMIIISTVGGSLIVLVVMALLLERILVGKK